MQVRVSESIACGHLKHSSQFKVTPFTESPYVRHFKDPNANSAVMHYVKFLIQVNWSNFTVPF